MRRTYFDTIILRPLTLNKSEKDGAGWLHWSALQGILNIHVEKNVTLEHPIIIHHLFTEKASHSLSSNRVIIKAGDLCDVNIIEVTTTGHASDVASFNATEIHLSLGARVHHIQLTDNFHLITF